MRITDNFNIDKAWSYQSNSIVWKVNRTYSERTSVNDDRFKTLLAPTKLQEKTIFA